MSAIRHLILIVITFLSPLSFVAQAAEYPERPVTIVSGLAAGGPTDVVARLVAEGLAQRLGQNFLVENRVGANSAIAYNSFARSPADGYTLLLMTGIIASLPFMQPGFQGEPVESVEPVSLLAMNSLSIVARGGAPYNTLDEMINFGKANPDKITYGVLGGFPEILGRYILKKENIVATYVPYKGAVDIRRDMLSGQIDVGFFSLVGISELIRDGQLKVIASTGRARSPLRPNVATIAEKYPGMEFEDINYFALVAPKGTPTAVLDKLHATIADILKSEDYQSKLRAFEAVAPSASREDLRNLMKSVYSWKQMANEVGLAAK